ELGRIARGPAGPTHIPQSGAEIVAAECFKLAEESLVLADAALPGAAREVSGQSVGPGSERAPVDTAARLERLPLGDVEMLLEPVRGELPQRRAARPLEAQPV